MVSVGQHRLLVSAKIKISGYPEDQSLDTDACCSVASRTMPLINCRYGYRGTDEGEIANHVHPLPDIRLLGIQGAEQEIYIDKSLDIAIPARVVVLDSNLGCVG